MSINKGNIGNALHSVAPDHVVVTADDIYDETLSKYQSELNQQIGQGGYNPPQGGIPKRDLSSSVQTSLDKADAAVPNTRTVNGKALSSNITLNASDVGALPNSTTIPTSLSQLSDDSTHRTVTDSEKTNWSDKYTKTEVNNMLVSAPEANVVVIENPNDADPTTLLPQTPATNTIYRVKSADGTYFSEYEHDGTKYVNLADRQYGIDNEPKPGSSNFPKSGGVDARLHELKQQIVDLSLIAPQEVVDGKFMLYDGFHNNENFKCYKYAIEPNKIYYFSGKYSSSVSIRFVYVYSSSDSYIDSYGLPDTTHGITYTDESFASPSNAAFAYLNVSKAYESCFGFAKNGNTMSNELKEIISANSLNADIANVYRSYFYDNVGTNYHPHKNFAVVKFRVDAERTYVLSNIFRAGTNIGMLFYTDLSDNYLAYGGIIGSATQDTIIDNMQVTTPVNAAYAYLNVYIGNDDWKNVKFSTNADNILSPVISPKRRILTPYEIKDGYFTIYTEERSNANFQIWRFEVQPNRQYILNGLFSNVSIPFIYLLDSNKSYIVHYEAGIQGALKTEDRWSFVTPSGTKYIYMNVSKTFLSTFSLVENGTDDDRTSEIVAALNRYKHVKLEAGVYTVSNLSMPLFSSIDGSGNSTVIKLAGNTDGYAIKPSKYCRVSNAMILGDYDDLSVSAPSDINSISIGDRHGVLFLGTGNNSDVEGNEIHGCEFRNFSGGGITLDNTGISTGKGIIVSDCNIKKCGVGINVAYYSEFNKFTNVVANTCKYGCIVNGGNNDFVNCDFSNCGIGVYLNGGTNKSVRYDGTAVTATNTAHGLMSGCTINHSGLAGNDNPGYAIVYLNTNGGFLFTGIQLHYGKMRFIDSESVQMCNCKFGYNVTLEAWSARLIVISNVTFNGLPGNSAYFKAKVCSDTSLTTRDTDYLSDGNLKKVRLINAYNYNGDQVTISSINNG